MNALKENRTEEAFQAQAEYCRKNQTPLFVPPGGRCFRCGRNIFGVDGIRPETAGSRLITGCPFCRVSFCD